MNEALYHPFLHMSKNTALKWEDGFTALNNFIPFYAQFANLCLNFFEWDFPADNEQLSGDFLERLLYYKGRCAVIRDKNNGLMVVDFSAIDGFSNLFGYPTRIQARDIFNYNRVIGEYDSEDFVIIPNNKLWYPTNITVVKYSIDIANILDSINLNVESQKFPVILQAADNEQKLTLEKLTEQIECGNRYIITKHSLNADSQVKSLEINAPFISDRLNDLQLKKTAELLTALGINNQNITKASGITSDEVNANNGLVLLNFDSMLIPRQEACDEIKRKFGINAWCDVKDYNTQGLSENLNEADEEVF